jgi:hypothetical protein
MDELAAGCHVILVLSDAYFRSEFCMYELREIHNNKDFRRRVYPIALTGARFHRPFDRIPYLRHWEEETTRLQEGIGSLGDPKNTQRLRQALDDYADFRRLMEKLLDNLADMNRLIEDVHVGIVSGQKMTSEMRREMTPEMMLLVDVLAFIERKSPGTPVRGAAEGLGARLKNLRFGT